MQIFLSSDPCLGDPYKGPFSPQRGCDPQVENSSSVIWHRDTDAEKRVWVSLCDFIPRSCIYKEKNRSCSKLSTVHYGFPKTLPGKDSLQDISPSQLSLVFPSLKRLTPEEIVNLFLCEPFHFSLSTTISPPPFWLSGAKDRTQNLEYMEPLFYFWPMCPSQPISFLTPFLWEEPLTSSSGTI